MSPTCPTFRIAVFGKTAAYILFSLNKRKSPFSKFFLNILDSLIPWFVPPFLRSSVPQFLMRQTLGVFSSCNFQNRPRKPAFSASVIDCPFYIIICKMPLDRSVFTCSRIAFYFFNILTNTTLFWGFNACFFWYVIGCIVKYHSKIKITYFYVAFAMW